MAIREEKNSRTRKVEVYAEGKLERVYVNELKEVKTYKGVNGPWTPTHTITFVIGGTKVFFGLTDNENKINKVINVRDAEGGWHQLMINDEVSTIVEKTGEWEGEDQYSSKFSQLIVVEKATNPIDPSDDSKGGRGASNSKDGGKYDPTPIEAGNARSSASIWISRGKAKPDQFNELVKDFATVSNKLRNKFVKGGLSSFEAGISVGQATLHAAYVCDSLEDVEKVVEDYVENLIPTSIEVIKGLGAEKESPKEKTTTKATTKAKPKNKAESFSVESEDLDDIPF